MLISAATDAPRGLSSARLLAKSDINGEEVIRKGHFASMAWPVPNAWSEIPAPRLMAEIPVSVSGSELAPITIAAKENRVWEVEAGGSLTIPLIHTRRSEFSGQNISLKPVGDVFSGIAAFDASLTAETSEVTLDLAKLKTPPGDYHLAFYGSAVAKYQYNLQAVEAAELALMSAKNRVADIQANADESAKETEAAVETADEQASAERLQAVSSRNGGRTGIG